MSNLTRFLFNTKSCALNETGYSELMPDTISYIISYHAGPSRACAALIARFNRAKTLASKIMIDRLLVGVRATMEAR